MTWQHITYLISIIIAAALMGFIAWYSRKQRASVAGAGVYMWIAFFASLLSIFQGLSMIGQSARWALFWFNMRILCFAAIPVFWLVFVLHYIGKTALFSKARIAILFVIPVITQIMLWTNDMHGWWVIHDVGFRQAGPFFIPDTSARVPGRWMHVHNLYTYATMLAGLVILFYQSMRLQREYRGQAITLATGTLVMMIGTVFPAFNLIPGMMLNPIPQSFALGSLIIAWGLYRHRFLGTSPLFDKERQIPRMIVMLFIFLASGIITTGFLYYRNYKTDFKTSIEQQLSSTLKLKVSDIARWREERLADAGVLFGNAAFTTLVRRSFADSPDGVAQEQIRNWLKKMQTNYHYDQVVLLDVQGNIRLSVPQSVEPVCGILKQQAAKIMRPARIVFLDLHREAPGKTIHLSVLVPIIENGRPLGIVALFIDPAVYLYPLINQWSTPSQTAETLLVRRDGNSVLYLNELKFRKDTALNLRVPLTEERMPAVMAALGREGAVEGIDYRGEKVVAAIRAIPDSPWIMVARIDSSEVYAPLRDWFWLMIVFLSALIVVSGSVVWLIWRRQNDQIYREKIEAAERLLESEEKFTRAFQTAPYAITITRPEDGRFIDVNEAFSAITGFTCDETLSSSSVSQGLWVNAEDRNYVVQELISGRKVVGQEYKFKKKNGDIITGLFSADIIKLQDGDFILSSINDISERKLAEEKISQSRKSLDAVMDSMDALAYVADMETFELLFLNKYGRDMFPGFAPGKKCYEVLQAGQTSRCTFCTNDRLVDAAGIPTGVYRWEFQNTKTGTWFECRDQAIRWHDRRNVRMEIATDITERKLMEEAVLKKSEELLAINVRLEEIMQTQERSRLSLLSILEDEKLTRISLLESEEKYRSILENMEESYFEVDLAGNFTFFNDSMCRLLEYPRDELMGMNNRQYNTEESAKKIYHAFNKVYKTGQSTRGFDLELISKDGRKMIVETSISLMKNTSDQPVGFSGIVQDVTVRKQTEREIRDVTERLHLATVSAKAGVWDWNLQTNEMIWDDRMLELYGLTRDNFPGGVEAWEKGLHQDDSSMAIEECQAAIRGERDFDTEFRVLHPDGTLINIKANGLVLRDENSKPLRMIGVNTDVTARKQAEEELRKHRYHLEELVEMRTKEIEKINAELVAEIGKRSETEKKLNIAKELADAANLAKSDFLANMSHELRTPLNSVIGFSEVLQNQLFGQLNEKQLEHVQYILGSGKHLLEVINDILDLSKVEAGKMELNPQIFAIKAMLIGVNLLFKEKALNHRIKTSVEIAADVPAQINADERKVKQIMFNLLSNALKFTPDGGSVKVTARLDKDNNGVALVVEDTGIGIKDDDLKNIFQPFFQIESTYTKTKTGTGLGLAITKKLVELHGGNIKMESEFGKGSKVTVTIPIGT